VHRKIGKYTRKVPDESGGYTVDHTAIVLLFDRNGQFTGTIAPEESDQAALAKLRRITA